MQCSSVASPHRHVCNLFVAGLFHPMQNGAITSTDLRAGMKEHITHAMIGIFSPSI